MTHATIQSEIFATVQDSEFIQLASEAAKELGITANEWNENRAAILLMMATEVTSK